MKTDCICEQVFAPEYFKKNKYIIDLGARKGEFSIPFQKKYGGIIDNYEPIKEACEILKNKKNIDENWQIFNKAIWYGKANIKDFYIWNKDNACLGSFFDKLAPHKPAKYDLKLEIETIPLKDAIRFNYVDLLKIDVEGAEYELLMNTDKKTFDKIGQICMELHAYCKSEYNHKKLLNFLINNNFKAFYERNINSNGFAFLSVINKNIIGEKNGNE